ncbi:GntR family transcriptional regulator [Streptomyces parvus]|uniref:GntR family transcriptional regulator n=1 Tax=Streptomyces parvus TaxID=66428 RepID=A0A7K3SAN2_9ACTN|nr:GntR family transcriptional regulator [Streptomyces parvus]NEC24594.1 GntR family transcriptional regulator [Streptomyces parvus]
MTDGAAAAHPYQRVAAALRDRIDRGLWPTGHRLPSRSALALEFAVGENVVRRALELLVAEGSLEGRAGSGTYVRLRQERRIMLRSLISQSRAGIAPHGFEGTWEAESVARVPPPAPVARRLRLTDGELCVRTAYEFLAPDRRPVMLTTSWEPMALTGKTVVVLPEGGPLAGQGVVARMSHIGITVTRAVERIHPVRVDRPQAELLGIATGAQATSIQRTHYDTGGRPVETADIVVPAEHWEIAYEIQIQLT